MDDSQPRDPRPEIPPDIRVVESIGDFELRYHIRDEEAATSRLATSGVQPLDSAAATRVAVTIYPLAIWLPDLETAQPMEVPDDEEFQGWEWSRDEHVLLDAHRDPDLPRLSNIVSWPKPSLSRLDIAGRPMCLWRAAPRSPGWVADVYLGDVYGFLDDATRFWARVIAPTESRREELLGAVATLERTFTAPG